MLQKFQIIGSVSSMKFFSSTRLRLHVNILYINRAVRV